MTSQPKIPPSGLIDLHCHLLPGVDDGCTAEDESLEAIRAWIESGFVGSVCTPHMGPTWYEENTPARLAPRVEQLRQHVADQEVDYQLWQGGEVRICPDAVDWFEQHGVPTLGAGRFVLLDWWGNHWPDYCDDCWRYLLEADYRPILAHPERMGLSDARWEEVLDSLQAAGVLLQGNLKSFAGGEGELAAQRARRLLQQDRYYVLASDTHGPEGIEVRRAGLTAVRQWCGDRQLATLLEERPREILTADSDE